MSYSSAHSKTNFQFITGKDNEHTTSGVAQSHGHGRRPLPLTRLPDSSENPGPSSSAPGNRNPNPNAVSREPRFCLFRVATVPHSPTHSDSLNLQSENNIQWKRHDMYSTTTPSVRRSSH